MHDHAFMDFAASESAQLDSDAAWLAWCDRAEAILGHDLDGDDSAESKAAGKSDGYSLDGAYDAFLDGVTADGYAQAVKSSPAYRRAIAAYTSAQRGADAARKAQIELERLLAAKRAGEEARSARYLAQRERAMRCAERDALMRRSADVPPPAPTWLAWTAMVALSIVLTLAAWSFAEYLLPMLWRLP